MPGEIRLFFMTLVYTLKQGVFHRKKYWPIQMPLIEFEGVFCVIILLYHYFFVERIHPW